VIILLVGERPSLATMTTNERAGIDSLAPADRERALSV
jgi:hypothetical protein